MLKFGVYKAQNILKRSAVGDFNIPTCHIGNNDEIFAGTCLESGSVPCSVDYRQGTCMVWIHGDIAPTSPNKVINFLMGKYTTRKPVGFMQSFFFVLLSMWFPGHHMVSMWYPLETM